ncbi:MAG: alpha/beta hydrolase-fold protein [Actinomycetota bacterium]|nr:alpha/beta hydrolase-fold protein [Actinomycetota bacterium]
MRASRLVIVAALFAAGCTESSSSAPASAVPATQPPTAATAAGTADTDVQRFSFTTADGTVIDYVLLVPDGRAPGQPGKVLLTFPPGGQDLELTQRIVEERWHDEALARGWVVVSPAAPSAGLFYSDESARLVPELLDVIATDFPPEGGKFDLAGVSNGGLSAFKAALSYPDRFRSLVVFPGYSQDGGNDPNLSKLADIGVSMFVGGEDAGWLDASQLTEQTLEQLGYTVELHVVAGEGHIIGSLTGAELFNAIERVRA